MRALLVVSGLVGVLLAGCGGSGGGGSATAKDSPGAAAVELPDYSQLEKLEPDTSGLRPTQSASEFEKSLKNGLRLALRDQTGAVVQTLGGEQELAADASAAGSGFSTTKVQVARACRRRRISFPGAHSAHRPRSYFPRCITVLSHSGYQCRCLRTC